jgi:uncharacterized protein (DUF302 family)
VKKEKTMEKTVGIKHVRCSSDISYEEFITKFEDQLGRHDQSLYQGLLGNSKSVKEVERILEHQEGSSGLMLFMIFDHGTLLQIKGAPRKARQYLIGNPLFAARMTEHDIRAGLYAPLRVLVYLDHSKKVVVEYDLPSSLFAQFNNEEVNKTARELDEKISLLIKHSLALETELGR